MRVLGTTGQVRTITEPGVRQDQKVSGLARQPLQSLVQSLAPASATGDRVEANILVGQNKSFPKG